MQLKARYDVGRIIPIRIGEDGSSLSAILLNDDFYSFMMNGRQVVNSICVLDAAHLIPFKMYAWIMCMPEKKLIEKLRNINDQRQIDKAPFLWHILTKRCWKYNNQFN